MASEEPDEGDELNAPVKIYALEQRAAHADEPRCVICGRYGEYVSDATESDVCSIECKRIDKEQSSKADTTAVTQFRYTEAAQVQEMTATYIAFIRKSLQIAVTGPAPRPILEFEHCSFPPFLKNNLAAAGFSTPTAVQLQGIPSVLSGVDLAVTAAPGTGKSLMYALPLVASLSSTPLPERQRPRILVLLSRREICIQVEALFQQLMRGFPSMRTSLLIGGLPLPNQLHRLKRRRPQVIIGTPGRVLDVLSADGSPLDLSGLAAFVMDEADDLISDSFHKAVTSIGAYIPSTAQVIATTATLNADAEKRLKPFFRDNASRLVRLSVGAIKGDAANVRHTILWVEEKSKRKRVLELLQDRRNCSFPAIIFVNSKMGSEMLAEAVTVKTGIQASFLHGDRPQSERLAVLEEFSQGKVPVLVATGVVARGVNLGDAKVVINFDMPPTVDEYIHATGRTGRNGTQGWSYTFLNRESEFLFSPLMEFLKALPAGRHTPMPSEFVNLALHAPKRARR